MPESKTPIGRGSLMQRERDGSQGKPQVPCGRDLRRPSPRADPTLANPPRFRMIDRDG